MDELQELIGAGQELALVLYYDDGQWEITPTQVRFRDPAGELLVIASREAFSDIVTAVNALSADDA